MNDVRKGQIALLFIKRRLRDKGVRLSPEFRQEIKDEAKSIGISAKEAMEFAEIIIRELFNETFGKLDK